MPAATAAQIPAAGEAKVNILILDMHDIPERDAVVRMNQQNGPAKLGFTTDSTGKKSLILKQGNIYHIVITKYDHDFDFGDREIPVRDGPIEYNLKFQIGFVDTGYSEVYTLKNVYFDYKLASLKEESYSALDELAAALKAKPSMVIEIAGHTDNAGSEEYNLQLSRKRAETVRSYLLSKGIEPKRVYAKGYGEIVPIAPNDTQEGMAMNRRTEVRIIRQ